MQKLIFLRQQYIDPTEDKLSKKETTSIQQNQFLQSVASFKEQMTSLSKSFKIVKELPPDVLLIEHPDEICSEMYDALLAADIVEIIDSIIPQNIDTIENSSELCCGGYDNILIASDNNDTSVDELKNKMSRYMK